jgi:hypothetical protein
MTGVALVLAGLTCADGGPGMGAARETVAVSFEGRWVGTVEGGGGKAVPVEWNNTLGSVQVDGVGGVGRFVRTGPGAINLVILEDAYPGTYALAGDRLILRVAVHGDTLRFTLRRAAPRKP